MRTMTFIVPGDPVPLARARIGKHSIYDSQKHEKFVASMQLTHQMAGEAMLKGPLEMQVTFYMSVDKAKRRLGQPHYFKPDLDNLVKYIGDISNKIIFNDDCAIYKIVATKLYDEKPRTVIVISEVDYVDPKREEIKKRAKV